MIGLLKFIFTAAVFGVIGFFLLSMSFGEKSLWEHLVGISETEEAEELKSEIGKKVDKATVDIKEKATKLAEEELLKHDTSTDASGEGPAEDKLTKEDRQELKKLIQARRLKEDIRSDQAALHSLIQKKQLEHQ